MLACSTISSIFPPQRNKRTQKKITKVIFEFVGKVEASNLNLIALEGIISV